MQLLKRLFGFVSNKRGPSDDEMSVWRQGRSQ